MSAGEYKRVTLTTGQVFKLADLVENERNRIRKLMEEHPEAKEDNEKLRAEIDELDDLTRALITNIG